MNDRTASIDKPADGAMIPPVDVFETPAGITLYADLPGVRKEDLNLRVEADTLTIEGKMSLPTPPDLEAIHTEIGIPAYRRAFTLSRDLDSARITAEFAHGVLKLSIPKAAHAQPRRIEIQAG